MLCWVELDEKKTAHNLNEQNYFIGIWQILCHFCQNITKFLFLIWKSYQFHFHHFYDFVKWNLPAYQHDVDLLLYSHERESKTDQGQRITEAEAFNLAFRYIYDVLSINNPKFTNRILLLYHKELAIKSNNRNSFICPQVLTLTSNVHQCSHFYQTLWRKDTTSILPF